MHVMASDYSETNSKIDWRFFQWASRQALKQLTLGAVTTLSGRLFQSATTLAEKDFIFDLAKSCRSFFAVATCLKVSCHCELGVLDLVKALSSAIPRGQWTTGKNGENWLQNHLSCPNDPRG